jgi:hypothetical protein
MKKIIGILLLSSLSLGIVYSTYAKAGCDPNPVTATYYDSSSPQQVIGYGNSSCVASTGRTAVGGVSCCGNGCYQE